MTTTLHFAQLTDIHLTEAPHTWGTLGAESGDLLRQSIADLNRMADLDFVLITGDAVDAATSAEIAVFNDIMRGLEKPWHFVPGNHDGYNDPDSPNTLPAHEAVPRIDPRLAEPVPYVQKAYWSRPVKPGVQLIGLDSRMDDTFNGVVDAEQLAWLERELDAHRDKLVLIAVHHPLYNLNPINERGWWRYFICDNGAQVEAVLDRHPDARLVLSGHHHASQIRRRGGRLHVSTGALSGYPCVYRTIRLDRQNSGWHVQIKTHSPANDGLVKKAYDLLVEADVAHQFDPGNPARWADFCAGEPDDHSFDGLLP
jgi:Icc protein